MDPLARQNALKLLSKYRELVLCRDIESAVHSHSKNKDNYYDNITRVAWNLNYSKDLKTPNVVFLTDNELLKGTLLEKIETDKKNRNEHFEKMLQEKYDNINESKYKSLLNCKRCGSSEISYDEKQTRSADESATIFCACSKCGQRWVMKS